MIKWQVAALLGLGVAAFAGTTEGNAPRSSEAVADADSFTGECAILTSQQWRPYGGCVPACEAQGCTFSGFNAVFKLCLCD